VELEWGWVRVAGGFGGVEGVEDEKSLHLLRELDVNAPQSCFSNRPAPLSEP